MSISSVMALNIETIENTDNPLVLKSKADIVSFPLSQENKHLIDAMKHKLNELGGVGLAAPQVNHGARIIAIYIPEEASLLRDNVTPYPMHIMINPEYEAISPESLLYDFEGCYSVASVAGKVPRFNQITVRYMDEEGRSHQTIEKGFYARVLQHEIDHLNGLLITDRLTQDCIQGSLEEMMALRRAELPNDKRALLDELMAKK